MAKVSIKSEKITPLGGIFHVRELFSRYVGPVIDEVLGLRCTSYGYQYSEIAGSRSGGRSGGQVIDLLFWKGKGFGSQSDFRFFVWLGHVDQGHVNRLKILPHLIYNSIGQSADTNHLTWTCSMFTHLVTDYIFLSILSVELEFWNNLLLSLPILSLRDSDDIAKKCQEIARVITRLALETILKEMTYTAIFLVVIRHIAWSDGFHYLTHLQTLFGNQQMDMIGHQAIGVDVTRNRWHHFDESPVVFGIIKNVLTVNTAQHHMIDACSAWFSWLSWHNTKFKDYTKTLQRYNLLWEFTNFLEKKINDLSPWSLANVCIDVLYLFKQKKNNVLKSIQVSQVKD